MSTNEREFRTQLSISSVGFSEKYEMVIFGTEEGTMSCWKITTLNDFTLTHIFDITATCEGRITCIECFDDITVSGSSDGTIALYKEEDFKGHLSLKAHTAQISGIIICGDIVFTSSYDGSVKCWIKSEQLMTYIGHCGSILNMLYIPLRQNEVPHDWKWDGPCDVLVTASSDSTAKIYSVMTGRCLLSLERHSAALTCVTVNHLCENIFTGSVDSTIICWKLTTGECLFTFSGHTCPITCLVMTNMLLFSGSMDGTVKVWGMDGEIRTLRGHSHSIRKIIVKRNSVLSSGGDGLVCMFDQNDETPQLKIKHKKPIIGINLLGNLLLTTSHDGDVKVNQLCIQNN